VHLVALALAAASGCVHTVTVKSEPAGASVFVDGKEIGRTPVTISEETGAMGLVTVELHSGDKAQRFAYERDAFAMVPIGVGVSLGAVSLGGGLALAMGSVVAFPFVSLLTVFSFGLAAPLFLGLVAMYTLGIVATVLGPQIPIWTIGLYGRQGPEEISVDFTGDEPVISSLPNDMFVPLLGHTPSSLPAARKSTPR
jgi:hypothetical protein